MTNEQSEVNPIEWAAAACADLMINNQLSGALNIVFSDKWVRYDLVSLGKINLNDAESESLARAQFNNQFPDALNWPLRLTRHGEQLLVAGIHPALFSSIQRIALDSKCRLNRLEPWLAHIWNTHEKTIRKIDGWLLFEEPGLFIVTLLKQGQLTHLHTQPFDDKQRESSLQLLLDRQAALLEHPPGRVHVFSDSKNLPVLSNPWQYQQLDIEPPKSKIFF